MGNERTLKEEIHFQLKQGGVTVKLILANLFVFILLQLFLVYSRLSGLEVYTSVSELLNALFSLHPSPKEFLHYPWGLITSLFAHFQFWHFAMNMLFLYFAGKLFEQHFNGKKLFFLYLVGGIAGGLFELLAHGLFSTFFTSQHVILGASGSVMAVFCAMAAYRPNLQVQLFGIFPIRLIFLAGIFVLLDLVSIGLNDHTAHIAHIGGAILGILSVQAMESRFNLLQIGERSIHFLSSFFKRLFNRKARMNVQYGGQRGSARVKTDEEYIQDARQRQMETDRILEKISKSGYDSLSRKEKEFLFKQSKNG
jgi:membrane associated rhomboid family serine protease